MDKLLAESFEVSESENLGLRNEGGTAVYRTGTPGGELFQGFLVFRKGAAVIANEDLGRRLQQPFRMPFGYSASTLLSADST